MTDRERRIATLAEANRRRHEQKRDAAFKAVTGLMKTGAAVNVHSVAQRAAVSRTFIYSQADILKTIRNATSESTHRLARPVKASSDASLRARLAGALDTIRDLKAENSELRSRVEALTGELTRQAERSDARRVVDLRSQ